MKRIHFATCMLTVLLFACSKSQAPDTNPDAPGTPVKTGNSVVTYTDESTFAATFSSYGFKNPTQITLDKTATQAGYNTGYGFNLTAANQVKGFKWDATDEATEDWRPQGLCGFTWGSKNYILVSWYGVGPDEISTQHNHYKGSRLALVDITDMSKITYRLILLVQNKTNYNTGLLFDKPVAPENPTQYDSFIPVTMHAGGLAYYNQKIYIVDTSLGIRVFDLNQLIDTVTPETAKNSVGKTTTGGLTAFEYTCILPQSGYYKITGEGSPFSSVSLGTGATATDMRLWTCQYLTSGAPLVYGFPINSAGSVSGPPTVVNPIDEVLATPVLRAQGAYRAGKTTYLSTTGNTSSAGSTARLIKYIDGAITGTRYNWPQGAEALYVDGGGLMWSLTEFETAKYGKDNRTVFAVRLSDY